MNTPKKQEPIPMIVVTGPPGDACPNVASVVCSVRARNDIS